MDKLVPARVEVEGLDGAKIESADYGHAHSAAVTEHGARCAWKHGQEQGEDGMVCGDGMDLAKMGRHGCGMKGVVVLGDACACETHLAVMHISMSPSHY